MSKKEILRSFKKLHRIAQETFQGDSYALGEARQKINVEFKKNIENEKHLEEQLKVAKDVGDILEMQVVQAVKKPESDDFALNLRKSTIKSDNYIFQDDVILPEPRNKKCKPTE